MKPSTKIVSALCIAQACLLQAVGAAARPNVILIMADDMGYGDPSYINSSVLKADGSAVNHGILLKLSDDTKDNGLGIQLIGDNAPYLEIRQIPVKVRRQQIVPKPEGDGNALQLIIQVPSDGTYYLHESFDLSDDWKDQGSLIASDELMNVWIPVGSNERGFYRVSTEAAISQN